MQGTFLFIQLSVRAFESYVGDEGPGLGVFVLVYHCPDRQQNYRIFKFGTCCFSGKNSVFNTRLTEHVT